MNDILLAYIRGAQPVTTAELITAARLKLIGGPFDFTETMVRQAVNSLSKYEKIVLTDDGWTVPKAARVTQRTMF